MKEFEKTKLYDLAMALPLCAIYGWGVWTVSLDIAARYRTLGLVPRFAAVMGTFAGATFSLMPIAPLPLAVAIFTMVPVIGGVIATIVVALWLGRQFSIMPEARRLVTAGPYAWVRHPLYLCEEIAIFGMALQHLQPWALMVFVCQFIFQIMRMHYEEQVLTSAFPEYTAYAARTARLIPGIY